MASPVILNALARGASAVDPDAFGRAAVRGEQIRSSQADTQNQNALTRMRQEGQDYEMRVGDEDRAMKAQQLQEQRRNSDILNAAAPVFMAPDDNQAAAAYTQGVGYLRQKYPDMQMPDQFPGAQGVFQMVAPMMPPELAQKIYEAKFAQKPPQPTNDQQNYAATQQDPKFGEFLTKQKTAVQQFKVDNPTSAGPRSIQYEEFPVEGGMWQKYRISQDGSRTPEGPAYQKSADASVDLRRDLQEEKKDREWSSLEQSTNDTIDLLDKLEKHPGLSASVGVPGVTGGALLGYTIPGTDAAGFKALHEQIGGRQFLQAYETLKGSGQITEIEGQKATNAIARLQRSQKESEFKQAISDFRTIIKTGMDRARQLRAKGQPAASPKPPGQGQQPASGAQEGATATNPKTGQKIVFRGGQWVAQ